MNFGRIPCAVHRPPHQKVRRKSVGKCKSVVTALLKALYNEMYEKTMKNTALGPPKPSPDAPRSLQNRAQAPLGQHLAARRHPRASKRCLRSAQEAPKSVQETPKNAQEPSKRCLGGPQTLTKSSLGAPKTRFWHVLREKVHSKGTRSDFSSFFGRCATRAMCLAHRKNL